MKEGIIKYNILMLNAITNQKTALSLHIYQINIQLKGVLR